MPNVCCQYCGKEFHIKPSALKRGRGKFCSISCRDAAWTKKPNRCIDCGVIIKQRAIRCRSCAQAERWANGDLGGEEVRERRSLAAQNRTQEYKALRSELSKKQWEDPDFRRMQEDARSAPEFREAISERNRQSWQNQEYRASMLAFLRSDKMRKAQRAKNSGAKCHLWRGGVSENPYDERFTKRLKRKIRKRDGYHCALCGCPETEKAHDVHHIDYDKMNSVPGNLITLCMHCHRKTNHNRSKWPAKLRKLVQQ